MFIFIFTVMARLEIKFCQIQLVFIRSNWYLNISLNIKLVILSHAVLAACLL